MSWGRLIGSALLTLCALGCAANRQNVANPAQPLPGDQTLTPEPQANENPQAQAAEAKGEEQAPGPARIESITSESSPQGTRIIIAADRPLNYTSWDADATTLVLDLPGADAGLLESVIIVGTTELAKIDVERPLSPSGAVHTRLNLSGRSAAHTRIEPSGNALYIHLAPPANQAGVTSAAVDPLPVVVNSAAAEPSSHPAVAPATALQNVRISGDAKAPVVTLEGDGSFEYKSFDLENPPRLVVDIIGVQNQVKARRLPVEDSGLTQVRISQFSNEPERVARVVFDLSRHEPYRFHQEGSSLTVVFGVDEAAALAAQEPTPVAVLEPEATSTSLVAVPAAPALPLPGETPAAHASAPATRAHDDVRPAASSITGPGRDVVLFDRSEPRQAVMIENSEPRQRAGLSTLPQAMFESRTIAGGKRHYRGEKISVAFRDADLREVMFFFADTMKMNVVLDPDVTGKVDIKLNQVPWDQAFQVILRNQGLDAIEEENVVRIAKTSKLRQEAADLRALKQAQEQAVDTVTFTRTLSYAKVTDAMTVLQQVKTDRGKIVSDVRTNTLIISDIPDKKAAYEGLLDAIDTQTPQVIIEARIVEAIRSFERDLGVNWAVGSTRSAPTGNATPWNFPNRVQFNADVNTAPAGFPSSGGIGLLLGNVANTLTLDIALETFEADGKVRILSSPRIATQNNQPATIEQGVQIPVVTTTATEVDVQYIPASLRLVVTPQITAEDTVIMKVKVENNQPSSTVVVASVPGIVTESVDTQILVRTGTTAVIGGVYKLQETEGETGIPGLRKIPFFGWLFKNHVNKKDSSELLIFITPKIVKNI